MNRIKKALLVLIPLLLVFLSLAIGSTMNLYPSELLTYMNKAVLGWFDPHTEVSWSTTETILWNVRLPRVILTFLVGAALASAGNVLQSIFRNPIVDPFTLGISSGAAFGAALAMLTALLPVQLSAFLFGVLAVILTYFVSYSKTQTSVVSMVLAGMIVSGIFTAMLTLLQYVSDPYKLQAIIQWTMGNLHTASWHKVQTTLLPICLGLALIGLLRWKLNLLALGDNEALAVGVNPIVLKLVFLALATMITAVSVAAVGVISLFGLVVPHISRMLYGTNNSILVWANISLGGSLLLIIDNFSRTIMPFEIPVGIFTMLIGAPVFIYLMRKNTISWN